MEIAPCEHCGLPLMPRQIHRCKEKSFVDGYNMAIETAARLIEEQEPRDTTGKLSALVAALKL